MAMRAVVGVTSNPTMFAKALSGGDAYEEQIAASGGDAKSVFLALVMLDVTKFVASFDRLLEQIRAKRHVSLRRFARRSRHRSGSSGGAGHGVEAPFAGEPFQLVRASVLELEARRQCESPRRLGDENLIPAGLAHDAAASCTATPRKLPPTSSTSPT